MKIGKENKIAVSEQQRGKGVGFERLRRITGYLTGNLNTWNSAKRAELSDRVCHSSKKK